MPGVGVAVIGAGLAGLHAASSLTRAGYGVTLLERRGFVGGRAAGRSIDGFSIDGTFPLVRSTDRALLSWIDESDLGSLLLPPQPAVLSQVFGSDIHALDTSSLSGLANIRGVTAWDKKRLLRLPRLMDRYRGKLDPNRPELAAGLDFRSARDFATLYFGKTLWDYWISPETTCHYASDEMELSRVAFLLARVSSREGKVSLGVLRRGLWELAEREASRLDVIRDVVVDEIVERRGGGYVIECSPAPGSDKPGNRTRPRAVEVDAVVIATSPREVGRIAAPVLVPAERDYFARYQGGPSLTLSLAFSSPISAHTNFVRVPNTESSSIECYLSESGVADGRAPIGAGLVTLRANERFASAHLKASDDVVEKSLLAGFSRFHPTAGDHLKFTLVRRSARGNPNFHVGAYRDLARFARVQEDRGRAGRRVYFAGDYLIGPSANQTIASGSRAALALDTHFGM